MHLKDLLAAIGVILNGLPQGLLALSFGFASIPTAFAFLVGALGNSVFGLVAPVSFQAETITLAGTMGKDMRERLSMLVFGAIFMIFIGAFGLLERIIDFIGPEITYGMMAGVGLMLAKVSISMIKNNRLVGLTSLVTSFFVYIFTFDLVYTIVASVLLSSLITFIKKEEIKPYVQESREFKLRKPIMNLSVLRGALAMTCLNIGANIAFGNITGSIANRGVDVDKLSIVSGTADLVSSLFGGGPVEVVISATAEAPNPVLSAVLMMLIMAAILFAGLLPRIGKYIPSESISGFLFILGSVVTLPSNALLALSSTSIAGGPIVGAVTMVVTSIFDPFVGMLAGSIFKYFLNII